MDNSSIVKCQVGVERHQMARLSMSSSAISGCRDYGMVFLGGNCEKHVDGDEEVEKEAQAFGVNIKDCIFTDNKYADLHIDQEQETNVTNLSLRKYEMSFRR